MRRDKIGRRIGRNAWREYVMDAYYAAAQAWEIECERVAIGYRTEIAEFAAANPRPTLKAFLIGLKGTWNVQPA